MTSQGGNYPGVVRPNYFQRAEGKYTSILNAEKARPNRIIDEDNLPGWNYTLDETEKVSAIMTDVQTYIDEMTAAFITGKQDFSKWDDYKKTLDKMGIQEYLELAQGAYDRSTKEK